MTTRRNTHGNPERRRHEAIERMRSYSWSDSKAKRTGSATKEQWSNALAREISRLSGGVNTTGPLSA